MACLRRLVSFTAMLCALSALTGCASAPSPQVPAALPLDFAQRYKLQLQVNPYVDTMPRVMLGLEEPPCADLIVLISIRAGADGFPQGLEIESATLTKRGPASMGQRELLGDSVSMWDFQFPPYWASTRFSGYVVEAKPREAYFMETLNSIKDWRGNRAVTAAGFAPPRWFPERTLRGALTGCPPWGWDAGDTLEVTLRIRAGDQRATLRATGLYGAAS